MVYLISKLRPLFIIVIGDNKLDFFDVGVSGTYETKNFHRKTCRFGNGGIHSACIFLIQITNSHIWTCISCRMDQISV